MAPFYRLFGGPENASAPITVVLIDEDTLAKLGTGYPLDDATLNTLLTKIACNAPKTMFLDMLLGGPRPGGEEVDDRLLGLMKAGKAASVQGNREEIPVPAKDCNLPMPPFYVADIPPPEKSALDAPPAKSLPGDVEIVASTIRDAARRLPVQWSNEHYIYPSWLEQSASIHAEGWATLPDLRLPTPALQLYADLQRTALPPSSVDEAKPPEKADLSGLPDKMVIGWGWKHRDLPVWYTDLHPLDPPAPPSTVRQWLCRFAETDNYPYPDDWKLRLLYATGISASQIVLSVVTLVRGWCGQPDGSPPQKYIYTLIVPAWQILAKSSALPKGAVEGAIKGRAVLIGQNVVGAADAVRSPVHGVVPGVVVHAQALDNLLTWHGRVWRPMPNIDFLPSWASFGWILGLSYLFILNFLTAFLPKQYRLSAIGTALCLVLLNFSIAMCWALVFCLAPINWVSYMLAISWDPLEKWLKGTAD